MLLASKIEEGAPTQGIYMYVWKMEKEREQILSKSFQKKHRPADILTFSATKFGLLSSQIVVICHSINRKRIQPWILTCIVVRSDNIPALTWILLNLFSLVLWPTIWSVWANGTLALLHLLVKLVVLFRPSPASINFCLLVPSIMFSN